MEKFERDSNGNLYLHRKPYILQVWKRSSRVADYLEYEYILHFRESREVRSGFDSEGEACEAVIKRVKKLLEEALKEAKEELERLESLYEEM